MRVDATTAPLVSGTFEGRAELFGFSPPPAPVRVRLEAGPTQWTLLVQPQRPVRSGALVDWLDAWRPLRVDFGTREIVRADFHPPPPHWAILYRGIGLERLELEADGHASAVVRGTRAAVAAFARLPQLPPSGVTVRHLGHPVPASPLLTKAQEEALRVAAEAGYYEIPRPVTLHDLARRLDVSCASLSERLRRAEGHVILRYLDGTERDRLLS